LEGNSGSSSLTILLVWSIEKYKIGVHEFSKILVVVKCRIMFGLTDLTVLFFNIEFILIELIANKYQLNLRNL